MLNRQFQEELLTFLLHPPNKHTIFKEHFQLI